jgi:hypothetical protein
MKQYEAVIQTIEKLGGAATLGQLYRETLKIKECQWKTKTPFASIRRITQTRKEIYKIRPGLYGLVKCRIENETNGLIVETKHNKNSKEILEFNHSYYQGLLLIIGNLRGFKTFAPTQDKNKKFIKTTIGEIRTIKTLPNFSHLNLVQRSSTIDAIWFNQREMPHSFFEIEYSTDIQNSLLKFNDLQDFYARMIIVADKSRKREYENKIRFSSFNDIKKRVLFLNYTSLYRQYENILEQEKFEVIL